MIKPESLQFHQNSDSDQAILVIPGVAPVDFIKKHLDATCVQKGTGMVDFTWADNTQSTIQSLDEISQFLKDTGVKRLGVMGISYGVLVGRLLVNFFETQQTEIKVEGFVSYVGAVTPLDLRPYARLAGTTLPRRRGTRERVRDFWRFSDHYPETSAGVPVLAITSLGPTIGNTSIRVPDTLLNHRKAAERMQSHSGQIRVVQTEGEGFWITDPSASRPRFNICGSHVTSISQHPYLAQDIHQFLTTGDLNAQFLTLS